MFKTPEPVTWSLTYSPLKAWSWLYLTDSGFETSVVFKPEGEELTKVEAENLCDLFQENKTGAMYIHGPY